LAGKMCTSALARISLEIEPADRPIDMLVEKTAREPQLLAKLVMPIEGVVRLVVERSLVDIVPKPAVIGAVGSNRLQRQILSQPPMLSAPYSGEGVKYLPPLTAGFLYGDI